MGDLIGAVENMPITQQNNQTKGKFKPTNGQPSLTASPYDNMELGTKRERKAYKDQQQTRLDEKQKLQESKKAAGKDNADKYAKAVAEQKAIVYSLGKELSSGLEATAKFL